MSTEGHIHTISQVSNLQSTLNGKANSSHSHSTSQISGLQSYVNNLIDQSSGSSIIIKYQQTTMENNVQSSIILQYTPFIVFFGYGIMGEHGISGAILPNERVTINSVGTFILSGNSFGAVSKMGTVQLCIFAFCNK